MKCPRCPDSALFQQGLPEVLVDICPSCRGLWLDRGELDRLLAARRRHGVEAELEDPLAPDDLLDFDEGRDVRRRQPPRRARRSRLGALLELFG